MFSIIFAQANPGIVKETPNTLQDFEKVFTNLITAAVPAAGIVLFIMLLLAGVSYVSAGDDPKKAASARSMMTYAILGLVLITVAFLILRFISAFTGVSSFLDFKIVQ